LFSKRKEIKMSIRYVHTNIIAKDWRKLCEFYIQVFDCKPLKPERDLSGSWVEELTGIKQVRIRGMHLQLPGYEDSEPTLEIFTYQPERPCQDQLAINQQGLGHLAFHVDDVDAVLAAVIAHGGKQLGDVINQRYESLGLLTAVYAADPEGNFIEIQNWNNGSEEASTDSFIEGLAQ
jgi:predicted enzyme related to lactoylglutathione lyase